MRRVSSTTVWALLAVIAQPGWAQTAPAAAVNAATLARYDRNSNGVLDADERATMEADQARAAQAVQPNATPSPANDEILTLSPFEVSSSEETGYLASNTLAGTRLNSRLEDIAGSISVVTKQQLVDTAALDINDIFLFEVGTEGTGQFTDLTNDGRGDYDNVAGNPTGANRMRGLSSANISVGGFTASSTIPIDTYNIDAVEIARGPNSNLAGLSDAGGTVNLVTSRGNVTRETTQLVLRADSFGGFRTSIDLNRPLIRNKLALRLSAVYNEVGYERKPSVDRTNRQQIAVTYRPYSGTTINASVENFHEFAQRANSVTPRDTVTLWKARGSPTYDPVTATYTVNGVRSGPITNINQLPPGLAGLGSANARILQFIDGGQINFLMRGAAPTNTIVGTSALNQFVQSSSVAVEGPLYKIPGTTDKSFYDWTDINIAASGYQRQEALIANASLDQSIINSPRQRLDANLAWRRENQEDYRRQFIGQLDGVGNTVAIDANERLLDGRPNPFFLRPFIGGVNPQVFKKPVDTDSYRAQLAYQIDLRRDSGWTKWLGSHRLIGYKEYSRTLSAPSNLRYHDSVIDNPNFLGAAVLNPTPTTNLSNSAGALFYPLYYMGNTKGGGVEYANEGPARTNGPFNASYLGATSTAWNVNEPVNIQEVYFALGTQKKKVRTEGASLQSFLLKDALVTTFGRRKDTVYTIDNLPTTLSGGFIDEDNLWNFGLNKRWREGETKTEGYVFRPFRPFTFLDRMEQGSGVSRFLAQAARGFSVHYNKSDSFRPADTAYNLYLAELPNPRGQSEEYGFSLNLFNNKFVMRVTHQETTQIASRAGTGVLATRAISLDFDIPGQTRPFDLYTAATTWQQQLNPALTLEQAQARAAEQIGYSQAQITSYSGKTIADSSDAVSRGWELELQFNPNRYWTVRATGNKQEAIDSSVSAYIQQFISERLPIWTTIRDPQGNLWWNTATGSGATDSPEGYFFTNVKTPLDLAITTQGKKKPQTREYTFNMITNYQLAQIVSERSWLSKVSVGGSYRWASKGAIGYLAGAPDADGVVRSLDRTKPVYDKAQGNLDLTLSYRTRLFRDRIGARFQLNVRNVTEDGGLKGVAVNPDGRYWQYRIIDPRQFILTTTFDF